MQWITITQGKYTLRVRPRGLDKYLSEGWTQIPTLGADQETPQPQAVGATPKAKKVKK